MIARALVTSALAPMMLLATTIGCQMPLRSAPAGGVTLRPVVVQEIVR